MNILDDKGSALRCYHCPLNRIDKCNPRTEKCKDVNPVCFGGERYYHIGGRLSEVKMKSQIAFVTLVLAMILISGSALKCYNCNLDKPGKCRLQLETCKDKNAVCSSGERYFPIDNSTLFFQQCMLPLKCFGLQKHKEYQNVKCCQGNFCNLHTATFTVPTS
ncbi:hypothetical protein QTP70_015065 [Hemibagrus guttatus]|uniref:UPAR/Ly6 domain-containing protein n=1 Tax=Hemibagrus guttatus TaxID=175788 RepID=A0AAE0RL94_9TELE|nr:hypothetical protein QTP70_015065 [Hemibagrus guttatus]